MYIHSNIKRMAPKNSTASIHLLASYSGEKEQIIDDPYYVSHLIQPLCRLQNQIKL